MYESRVLPLGSEGDHKALYDGICLRNQIFSNISDERGKVMVLLEASLQVSIFYPSSLHLVIYRVSSGDNWTR